MKNHSRTITQRCDAKKHRYLRKFFIFCFVLLAATSGFCMISDPVSVSAAAPKLNKKNFSVKEGKTTTLTVKKPTSRVTWSSSNPKVVRITKKSGSKKAKVTLKGLKAGKAKITAKVGKKRLSITITVKHVHKWRGYATCTSKDTCRTCGATRGKLANHNWSQRTCQRPETCSDCGKTRGTVSSHEWGTDNICRMCRLRNLNAYMAMYIPDASIGQGDLMYFWLITNTNINTTVFASDPQSYGTATAYDGSHRPLKRLIAWENGGASGPLQLASGAGSYLFCMRSFDYAPFRFPSDGSIEFELWFNFEHYQISVKCSNNSASNYTYTRLP